MRFDTGQQMRMDQRMKLDPRMIQSMEILQMPTPALEERIEQELASNPTLEGDGTALYLAESLTNLGVKVTRLARGMPVGSSLQTVSKAVLSDAIQARTQSG